MYRDISAKEFELYSKEKKKQYIANLVIRASGSESVAIGGAPIAIVMAGLPGAGKTEFLDSFAELLAKEGLRPFVRIDLDQIVTVFPRYTPQSYDRFRSQGNYALARCVDVAIKGRYNMMVDGTFSGISGASLNNVEKLLTSGYLVFMYYMYDDAFTAWNYTVKRELETKRGISKEGFIKSCEYITKNVAEASNRFMSNDRFQLRVIKQKQLRDKQYVILSEKEDIDSIIKQGYNIDRIVEML